MAEYVFTLRDDGDAWAKLSPAEMQAVFGRYMAWFDRLQKTGRLKASQKLRDQQGRVVRRNGTGVVVTDGPFAEAKEVVGGFFILEAPNYDEAVAVVHDCPHLDFGSIEVREVERLRG